MKVAASEKAAENREKVKTVKMFKMAEMAGSNRGCGRRTNFILGG